jgi:hypothetical protein
MKKAIFALAAAVAMIGAIAPAHADYYHHDRYYHHRHHRHHHYYRCRSVRVHHHWERRCY